MIAPLPPTHETNINSELTHGIPPPRRGLIVSQPLEAGSHVPSPSPDVHALDSLDKLMEYHAKLAGSGPGSSMEYEPRHLALVAQSFLKSKHLARVGEDLLPESGGQQPGKNPTPEPGEVIESPRLSGIDATTRAKELKDELLKKKRKAQWEASMIKKEVRSPSLTGRQPELDDREAAYPRKRHRQGYEERANGDIEGRPESDNGERRVQEESDIQRGAEGVNDRTHWQSSRRSHSSLGNDEAESGAARRSGSIYEPSTTNFVPERYRKKRHSIRTDERRSLTPPRVVIQPPSASTVTLTE